MIKKRVTQRTTATQILLQEEKTETMERKSNYQMGKRNQKKQDTDEEVASAEEAAKGKHYRREY